jgi:hypothetical protein
MVIAPFIFPLFFPCVVPPYHVIDISQYLLREFDRRQPKLQNFFVGVVFGNIGKFFFEIVGLEPATGHYSVNGAVAHEVFVSLVYFNISSRHPSDNARELLFHIRVIDAVNHSEHFLHVLHVFPFHLPNVRRICFGAGLLSILDVENVFEVRIFRVHVVDEGDALGTAFDPPAHPFIPKIHSGAGCSVGLLSVNKHLVHKRIFVHLSRAVEERRPAFGVFGHVGHVGSKYIRRFLYLLADYRAFGKNIDRHKITSLCFLVFAGPARLAVFRWRPAL